MRKWIIPASAGLMVAACGGGSSSSPTVAVVPGPTTSTPTSTPSPTPTPTPTPTSNYTRYADLTGDQTFQTACASVVLGSGLPSPQSALPFGQSLVLAHTAATGAWTVSGDAVSLSFAAGDAVTVPAGQSSYVHAVNGSNQTLTITTPAPSGTMLNYTRSLSLRTDKSAGSTLYGCVFGVPSLTTDLPTAAVTYATAAITGTAYMLDASGAVQTYVLSGSSGSLAFAPTTGAVSVKLQLAGNLQTSGGLASASTALGNYTGQASADTARVSFSGSLDSSDHVNLFSSFSGAFFGGVEAASAFEILATDTTSGRQVVVIGTIAADQ